MPYTASLSPCLCHSVLTYWKIGYFVCSDSYQFVWRFYFFNQTYLLNKGDALFREELCHLSRRRAAMPVSVSWSAIHARLRRIKPPRQNRWIDRKGLLWARCPVVSFSLADIERTPVINRFLPMYKTDAGRKYRQNWLTEVFVTENRLIYRTIWNE